MPSAWPTRPGGNPGKTSPGVSRAAPGPPLAASCQATKGAGPWEVYHESIRCIWVQHQPRTNGFPLPGCAGHREGVAHGLPAHVSGCIERARWCGYGGATQRAPGPYPWAIDPQCEAALDRYEGYPTLYRKETLSVAGITWLPNEITAMPTNVTEVSAMIYVMNTGHPALPSDHYYMDTIVQGYRAVGFHVRYLAEGIRRTQRQKERP